MKYIYNYILVYIFIIMKRIKLTENQLDYLLEYHSQTRLRFYDDDGRYSKVNSDNNMAEEFTDWIEEFGRHGKLKPSSISFEEGIAKGYDTATKWMEKNNNTNISFDYDELLDEHGFLSNCDFDSNGNLYIERTIKLNMLLSEPAEGEYTNLLYKYQNNVGGCWTWKKGASEAYCSKSHGAKIVLCGYIRLDDIDWNETVYLNMYHANEECEIRVKPNASIELFDVYSCVNNEFYTNFKGDYHFKLNYPIIVKGTYFGNRGEYDGEYANIHDSSSDDKKLMDRNGNILLAKEIFLNEINYYFNNDVDIDLVFGKENVHHFLYKGRFCIIRKYDLSCIIDIFEKKILGGEIFDRVSYDSSFGFIVMKNKLFNILNFNGTYKINQYVYNIRISGNILFAVNEHNNFNIIKKDGSLGETFDSIHYPKASDIKFDKKYIEVSKSNKYNLIDKENGKLFSDIWFDDYFMDSIKGLDYIFYEIGNERHFNDLNGNNIDNLFYNI